MDRVEQTGNQAEEQGITSGLGTQISPKEDNGQSIEGNKSVLRPSNVRVQDQGRIQTASHGDPNRHLPGNFEHSGQDRIQRNVKRAHEQRVDGEGGFVDGGGVGEQPEGGQQKQRVSEVIELGVLHIGQVCRPGEIPSIAQIAHLVGEDDRLLQLQARQPVNGDQQQIGQYEVADAGRRPRSQRILVRRMRHE